MAPTDKPAALKVGSGKGHPGLREQIGELARPPDTRDMPKDIATQTAGILALAE